MILLSLLAVPLVIGIAASLTRRAWWDKRAADRHHQAIEVLARITREQAEINGATHHAPVADQSNWSADPHAGLRVLPTGEAELTPRRGVVPSRARSLDSTPAEAPAAPPGPPPSRLPPPAVRDVPGPPTRPAVVRRPDLSPAPGPQPAHPVASPPPPPPQPAHPVAPPLPPPPPPEPEPEPATLAPASSTNGAAATPLTLYFDDTPPQGTDAVRLSAPPVRTRSERRRRPRLRRRGASTTLVASVAVVAIGGATAAAVMLSSRGSGSPARRAAGPPVTAPAATQATAPPTTAAPPPTVTGPVQETAADGSTAWVYRVPAGAHVMVASIGSCWVDAHQGDSQGLDVFQALMIPGQTHALTGPLWIRLGDPSQVSITVNGAALPRPPAIRGEPYNVQLVAS